MYKGVRGHWSTSTAPLSGMKKWGTTPFSKQSLTCSFYASARFPWSNIYLLSSPFYNLPCAPIDWRKSAWTTFLYPRCRPTDPLPSLIQSSSAARGQLKWWSCRYSTFSSIAEVVGWAKYTLGVVGNHARVTWGAVLLSSRSWQLHSTRQVLKTDLGLRPHVFHLGLKFTYRIYSINRRPRISASLESRNIL